MFTQISSAGIRGMEGFLVSVEADVSNGLPGFSISGQLALEVREAQERVRTALKNSDFQLPAKKITVNLSPAGRRKPANKKSSVFLKKISKIRFDILCITFKPPEMPALKVVI